jgi:hypothetical protein
MSVVESALAAMGTSGAIISVLMGVISVLSGVIAKQYADAAKIYKYRLAERDTLTKALSDSTAALEALIKSMDTRNVVTDELSDLIMKQGMAFEHLNERSKNQYDIMREDTHRIEQAISSIAEAMRNVVSLTESIKNDLPHFIAAVRAAIANLRARKQG